jgi:DNA helicase II / ATP-dependent DNA helicase PcrA
MPELSIEEKLALVKTRLNSLDRNLSEEQLDFILQPVDKACYLKACPGSGKTEVVGIKAAYEIAGWKDKYIGIAVLSFTKNAAKEIAERIKIYGGANAAQHPHFIGTIDSWLHGYLLHPFAYKETGFRGRKGNKSYSLIENSTEMDFLRNNKYHVNYQTEIKTKNGKTVLDNAGNPKTKLVPFYATEFFLSHDGNPMPNMEDKKFHKNIKQTDLIKIKQNLNEDGFCTYQDAEHICYRVLKYNQPKLDALAKRFPLIIVDECQDLSQNQLRTFHLLIEKGVTIFLVGDVNQSIYEFRRVDISKIDAFIKHHKLEQILLTKNFRSNQKVVNISMGLEKYNTGDIPMSIVGNEVERVNKSCILWQYEANEFPQLPQKFIDHLNRVNSSIKKPESKIAIGKSGILARAHTTLAGFRNYPASGLSKIELFANALNCWANNPRTSKDMQNALHQIGKAISLLAYDGSGNHQHQYCPEVYNKIEWRNQLSDLIVKVTNITTGVYPFASLTWTQWVAKLKVFLENYWTNFRSPTNEWDSVKAKIKSPTGYATKLVIDTVKASQNNYSEKIRMTTFHDVKGETLDAVLVVSSATGHSQGGYYEHWLTEDVEKKEHVRFAYVASSRPKHLLIWAIPKIANNQFINKIKDLGFEAE